MHLQKLSCDGLRALDTAEDDYDGVHAYCVTHRARVLLTKRWAARHPRLRCRVGIPGGWRRRASGTRRQWQASTR